MELMFLGKMMSLMWSDLGFIWGLSWIFLDRYLGFYLNFADEMSHFTG
jgi:hypothetical protein